MVKWCNGDIKYGKRIRTHRNYSSLPDKGTQCENNPCYYFWRSCEHLHVPLVLYPPFTMGGIFSKLPLQLLLLLRILIYFDLYPLILILPFALRTPFYLRLLPQFPFSHHRELQNHLLKEKSIMRNGEMVSVNQTMYLNPHGEMEKTPFINDDIFKSQLNSSLSTTRIYSPIFNQLFPALML